ncbi:hypothetical protein CkaCkLH20_11023 [Colletotrichum karsti]|uniref:BTB domain-containing protein n=1 Tax=Colletotrichum karsti TaxID=1095194 RepID=A0A9P6HYD8_9PEZI|nr:uncharacterized protein CkaCkLH20_11023 [Colletotrichum karsti]KAF9871376.1 hypothetical protein CkaCkLH20_11023 [Colletotrichum karsti]
MESRSYLTRKPVAGMDSTSITTKVKDFGAPTPKPRPPIAPNGDLTLLVGPEPNHHPLRVHSLVLKNASPVFASMLQPPYLESATLFTATPSSPARISLPEDDPLAVETICRVLHNRADAAVYELSAEEVLRVAVAADKYDCAGAMALAAEYWLSPGKLEGLMNAARDGCIGFRRCDLLLASYWFKHERVFGEVTRALVVNVVGGFEGLVEGREGVEEVLAWRLALALEQQRNNLRLSLYTIIMDRTTVSSSLRPRIFLGLHWPERQTQNSVISNVLRSIDRGIFSHGIMYMSIDEALRRALEIPMGAYNRMMSLVKVTDQKELYGCREKRSSYKEHIIAGVSRWRKDKLMGLCLACLHEQMECSVEHVGDGKERREWEEMAAELK